MYDFSIFLIIILFIALMNFLNDEKHLWFNNIRDLVREHYGKSINVRSGFRKKI